MVPELNFVYYSFITSGSWFICFKDNDKITMKSFDSGKTYETTVNDLIGAIEEKQMREDKRQNQMIKYYNSINKVTTKK